MKARLAPGLIAVVSVLMPVALLGWRGTVGAGVVGLALMTGLAALTRARGKVAETDLWSRWGGMPAAQMLRHDSSTNKDLLVRARRSLEGIADIQLPSEADEERQPEKANDRYEAAVRIGLERFRNRSQSKMIRWENIAYGYYRNLYSLRPIALTLIGIAIVAISSLAIGEFLWQWGIDLKLVALAGAAEFGLLWFWAGHVREELVRSAADTFAGAMLRTLASLDQDERARHG